MTRDAVGMTSASAALHAVPAWSAVSDALAARECLAHAVVFGSYRAQMKEQLASLTTRRTAWAPFWIEMTRDAVGMASASAALHAAPAWSAVSDALAARECLAHAVVFGSYRGQMKE